MMNKNITLNNISENLGHNHYYDISDFFERNIVNLIILMILGLIFIFVWTLLVNNLKMSVINGSSTWEEYSWHKINYMKKDVKIHKIEKYKNKKINYKKINSKKDDDKNTNCLVIKEQVCFYEYNYYKANFNHGVYKNLKFLFYSSCFYNKSNDFYKEFKNIFINDDFLDHINWEFLIKYDKFEKE